MRKMHSFTRLHSQGETRPPVPLTCRLKRGARRVIRGARSARRGLFHVKRGPGGAERGPWGLGFVLICARRGGRAIIAALVRGPAPGNLERIEKWAIEFYSKWSGALLNSARLFIVIGPGIARQRLCANWLAA